MIQLVPLFFMFCSFFWAQQNVKNIIVKEQNVAYLGALTPDGQHFAYTLLPQNKEESSELRILDLTTHKIQSLGKIPLTQPPLPNSITQFTWSMVVKGVTNEFKQIFLSQLPSQPGEKLLVWEKETGQVKPLDISGNAKLWPMNGPPLPLFVFHNSVKETVLFDTQTGQIVQRTPNPDRLQIQTFFYWKGGFYTLTRKYIKEKLVYITPLWPHYSDIPISTLNSKQGLDEMNRSETLYPKFLNVLEKGEGSLLFISGNTLLEQKSTTDQVQERNELEMLSTGSYSLSPGITLDPETDQLLSAQIHTPNSLNPEPEHALKVLTRLNQRVVKIVRHDREGKKLSEADIEVTPLYEILNPVALKDFKEIQKTGRLYRNEITPKDSVFIFNINADQLAIGINLYIHYGIWGRGYTLTALVNTKTKELVSWNPEVITASSYGIRSEAPNSFYLVSPKNQEVLYIESNILKVFPFGK